MQILRKLLWAVVGIVLIGYLGLFVWAYWPGAPEVPERSLAQAGDEFVTVDGLALRYRKYGLSGAGRPQLLLLHGFGNSLQSWRALAPLLAECCDVVAIDMPGFGLSDKPIEYDYHNAHQALVLIHAAHTLGMNHVIYVGHSLGGAIALQAVVQDPDAAGLVLMNPGILSTGVPKTVQITLPPLPRMSAKLFGNRSFRGDFLRKSYVHPELVTEQVIDDVMLATRSQGFLAGTTSMMKQYAEGEEVRLAARVHVPTLILWGNQDRNKPRSEGDALQRLLPGSALVRFDDSGHYVQEELPAGVAQALQQWLTRSNPAQQRVAGGKISRGTDNAHRRNSPQ